MLFAVSSKKEEKKKKEKKRKRKKGKKEKKKKRREKRKKKKKETLGNVKTFLPWFDSSKVVLVVVGRSVLVIFDTKLPVWLM